MSVWGKDLSLASPPSDPQQEMVWSAEPQDSAPFFQCTAKEVAAWRDRQGAWLGGAEPPALPAWAHSEQR